MWNDALKAMKKNSGLTTTQIAEQSGIPEPTLEKLFQKKHFVLIYPEEEMWFNYKKPRPRKNRSISLCL